MVEATQLGANEYLLKPVSTKALFERLASVLARPRPMVRIGDYYGPKPRTNTTGFDPPYTLPGAPSAAPPRAAPPQADRQRRQDRQEPDRRETKDDIVLI